MLQGRKVVLSLFTEEDVEKLYALDSDISARGDHFPVTLHALTEMRKQFRETGWWEEDKGRMVIAGEDSSMIGAIVFFRPSPMLVGYEIGYTISDPRTAAKAT